MNPLYAPLYAHVMVLFWLWLWWQLRAIERWRQQTGRGLLIAADAYGRSAGSRMRPTGPSSVHRSQTCWPAPSAALTPHLRISFGGERLSVQAGLTARDSGLRREGLPLPHT